MLLWSYSILEMSQSFPSKKEFDASSFKRDISRLLFKSFLSPAASSFFMSAWPLKVAAKLNFSWSISQLNFWQMLKLSLSWRDSIWDCWALETLIAGILDFMFDLDLLDLLQCDFLFDESIRGILDSNLEARCLELYEIIECFNFDYIVCLLCCGEL